MVEVLANTDMLIKMLENGIVPRLPDVRLGSNNFDDPFAFAKSRGIMNDIISIEYEGEEEVQCIAIDDEDHLYITDDFIPTHNTSNIVFLKSTDDSMIDTLTKMSGTTHKVYRSSKNVTKNVKALIKPFSNEAMIGYQMTVAEEAVIKYNDLAFIPERNSIVFRAGDSPIWNRNETILPMSWRLFKNTIKVPGKDYSLQTIPTSSTAIDFDVRKNQPNFSKMLKKRMEQAYIAEEAQEKYRAAYEYTDFDIEQLDPDIYADEIMDLICSELNPQEMKDAIEKAALDQTDDQMTDDEYEEVFDYMFGNQSVNDAKFKVEQDIYNEFDTIEDNKEVTDEVDKLMQEQKALSLMRYAGKHISRDMLVSKTGYSHGLDAAIIKVYQDIRAYMEKDTKYFTVRDGSLYSVDGVLYIRNTMTSNDMKRLSDASKEESSRVFSESEIGEKDEMDVGSFEVMDEFYDFLVKFPKAWPFANGEFEIRMKHEMEGQDE